MTTRARERFMLQHVWKTGGTEFCYLVRANGWSTPPSHNCYLHVPGLDWPIEDYDMIANERPMMVKDGSIVTKFRNPQAAATTTTSKKGSNEQDDAVYNIKWITFLRHPYSRTLSHYAHMKALNRSEDFTIPEFLTRVSSHLDAHFWNFVPNQQTRWHCGKRECRDVELNPDHLVQAMSNLNQVHVVLILEDMNDPNSCTRLQMRHVLKLTKFEVLADAATDVAVHPTTTNNSSSFSSSSSSVLQDTLTRRPFTNWYKQVVPEFGPLVLEHDGRSTWDIINLQVMAAMAIHNDMDLQLYGYARKLCQERAAVLRRNLARRHDGFSPVVVTHHHHRNHGRLLQSPMTQITGLELDRAFLLTSLLLSSVLAILLLWTITWSSLRRLRLFRFDRLISTIGHRHPRKA